MRINVFARDLGWLFEDFKLLFANAGALVSDDPVIDVDGWLCVRSTEAVLSPDLSKTVIQLHTMVDKWTGDWDWLGRAAGFILAHPGQLGLLSKHGIKVDEKPLLIRPIGASRDLTVRQSVPDTFVAGWVGRNSGKFKRVDLFVDALKRLSRVIPCGAVMVGAQLAQEANELNQCSIPCLYIERQPHEPASSIPYSKCYEMMDVLCITSESEAGPLPLFEALRCGVPVISTDCGWSRTILTPGRGIIANPTAQNFAGAMLFMARQRDRWFEIRHRLHDGVAAYVLEDWINSSLIFTESVLLAGNPRLIRSVN